MGYSLIFSITNSENKTKYQVEWSNPFENIVNLSSVAPIFEGETDEVAFNDLIDTLFRIENEMNKFVTESKVVIDSR